MSPLFFCQILSLFEAIKNFRPKHYIVFRYVQVPLPIFIRSKLTIEQLVRGKRETVVMPKQIVRWKLYSLAALVMFVSLIVSDSYVLASEPPSTGVAVIIGNKNYGGLIPNVDFAQNDANAFKRFVIDSLGYLPKNIIDLRDATKAQLESAFGNRETHEGKIWRYLDPRGTSDVIVFYSGHGVPGLKDKRGYLLPVGADPDTPEINGYPIDTLLSNLGKLNTKSVTVYLDACFSGNSPNGMLIRAASGISIVPKAPTGMSSKMTIITAAQGDQVASWDLKAKHGLFTKYLLEALNGAANSAEYGVDDFSVSLSEVNKFLDHNMTGAARRLFGRHQNVSIQGVGKNALAYPYKKRMLQLDSADTKIAEYQYLLGRVYRTGESGIKKNIKKFVLWTQRAAEQGHVGAQYNIGVLYFLGDGVSKDVREALKWFRKAAEQGLAEAQDRIGYSYYRGEGITQNFREAMRWSRKAAEQGHAKAQFNIGSMYIRGEGVAEDIGEALNWFRKAAEQGHAEAQVILGFVYDNGEGVTQDFGEALKWYRKAAEQGNANAQSNIGRMHEFGRGLTTDVREAAKWYRKAAEHGDADAQFSLGRIYLFGKGVSADKQEAVTWFRKAAEQGHKLATEKLKQLGKL